MVLQATIDMLVGMKMTAMAAELSSQLGSAPQPRQDKQQKHKAKQSESGPQG